MSTTANSKTSSARDLAPGGDEAVRHGCICPRMDNCHGEGMIIDGARQFWIAQDCPIHGWEDYHDKEDNETSRNGPLEES